MDVLLSHGYFLGEDPGERKVMKPYPPLGLLYLAADLRDSGFQAGVYDSTFGSRTGLLQELDRQRPPVVGLYCNLITRRPILDLIQICRVRGIRVVLGGPEPANYPAEYLRRGADAIVIGEGEATFRKLLPRLLLPQVSGLEEIEGICFLDKRLELVQTPARPYIQDLDRLSWPLREAIDLDCYLKTWRRHHGYSAVSLITSRGCPYTCSWCSHGVYGYSYRNRSVSNVADEVEFLLDRYRPDMLWYADDVFALNRRWFFEFARELERRRVRVPFETISREDRLDEEVIRGLADMGCRRIWIGAESGSQRILDAMHRRTQAARVPEVIRLLRTHGIETGLFIMLGYDGEQFTDLQFTVDFLKEASPDTFLTTVAYPIKGTPYYEEVEDRLVRDQPWESSTDRDLRIAGHPGPRYYRFAQRWMAGELALHHAAKGHSLSLGTRAKAYLNSRYGRIGMAVTGPKSRSPKGGHRRGG